MTAAKPAVFQEWLYHKLKELNTDENIFGSYIISILEGDETQEEKEDALAGILGEIVEDIDALKMDVLNKWIETQPKEDDLEKKTIKINVDLQLAKLLEVQSIQAAPKERTFTEEERQIKEKILANYSQTEVSDNEETVPNEGEKPTVTTSVTGLARNTNAEDVAQLQKDKREQARLDSAAKKLKDREDREKQRQMREEKKEKRKTVKNEKRR